MKYNIKLHSLALMSAAALTLSSCGIYSSYEAKNEVPDGLFGDTPAEAQATDSSSLAKVPWRDVFTDPQLQNLITEVLNNNIDLQTAQLNIEQAQAQFKASRLAFAPSLSFAPNGALSKYNIDGAEVSKTYTIPVSLQWQIDAFGSLRNQKRASKASLQATEDALQATQTALVANTASLYYSLLMLDRQLEIADSTAESWKVTVETMKAMMDAGMTNEASVAQMEGTYYSIVAQVADIKDNIVTVQNSLCLLMAKPSQHIDRGRLDEQHIDVNLSAGLPLDIISNRPDVRAQERQLEAYFYSANASRSAYYPTITLSGQAGWTNLIGSTIMNPGKFFWQAAASLVQPIFQNGQIRARVKIAEAQQKQAELAWTKAVLTAGNEVNEALVSYQTAKEKRDLYQNQVEALTRAYEATDLMMKHGSTTYLEVLTAKQTLLSAQLSQTANTYSELSAIITLYQAVGGGTL